MSDQNAPGPTAEASDGASGSSSSVVNATNGNSASSEVGGVSGEGKDASSTALNSEGGDSSSSSKVPEQPPPPPEPEKPRETVLLSTASALVLLRCLLAGHAFGISYEELLQLASPKVGEKGGELPESTIQGAIADLIQKGVLQCQLSQEGTAGPWAHRYSAVRDRDSRLEGIIGGLENNGMSSQHKRDDFSINRIKPVS